MTIASSVCSRHRLDRGELRTDRWEHGLDRGGLTADRWEFGLGSRGAAGTATRAAGRQAWRGGQAP